jgi:predicted RNA-binding protein
LEGYRREYCIWFHFFAGAAMGQTFICAVAAAYPENYEIGIRAGKWGVAEKHWRRIAPVKDGDLIVFVVGGMFRSIHRVIGEPFEERSPLWPANNGDIYPYRIRISPAVASGKVRVGDLAPQISFMRDKQAWHGTLQGANGVLNARMTDADLYLIQHELTEDAVVEEPEHRKSVAVPLLELPPAEWVPGLLEQLAHLSQLERADVYPDPWMNADEWRRGLFAGVYADVARVPTVAVMPVERSPGDTVLSTLYGLSSLKQSSTRVKDVRGLIFVREHEESYGQLLRGIPNISTIGFDIRISLR